MRSLRSIGGEELLADLDRVMHAIAAGAVFEVSDQPSPFVLGPPSLGRVFAIFDEREYGWPEPVDVRAIVSIEDLTPGYRRHPLVVRDGSPIALSIKRAEYARLFAPEADGS